MFTVFVPLHCKESQLMHGMEDPSVPAGICKTTSYSKSHTAARTHVTYTRAQDDDDYEDKQATSEHGSKEWITYTTGELTKLQSSDYCTYKNKCTSLTQNGHTTGFKSNKWEI